MLTRSPNGLADDLSGFLGPDEGRWVLVPVIDVVSDVTNELLDGHEGSSSHRTLREDAEPCFDHVQPRRSCGREVEVDALMCFEPSHNIGSRVSRGVVEND